MVNDESLVNAADFADRIAYTADFTFPDGSAAPTASSTGAPVTLVFVPDADPQDGRAAFSVEVANPSDGRKPIAGVYREAFRLSFVQDGQIPASSFP